MQQELNTALSQLRELQDNLTELQKAHQVTQNQLRDKETINALIKSGLDGYCQSVSWRSCFSEEVLNAFCNSF